MSTVISLDKKPFPFALQKDVWKHYLQSRPAYPDSLWHEWIEYHQGPLDTAHELGTGCGVGAASLLSASNARGKPIKHMILSDPSESNVNTSKELLKSDDFPGTRLSFHQKTGEDSFLEPGSVDMVIACECLHFTDIEKAISSIHKSLRPGGTVASVFYGVLNARIRDNERADAAWKAFGKMHFQRVLDENIETLIDRITNSKVFLGLNFVPLEKDLWQDVKRIFINLPEGQTHWPRDVGLPEGAKPKAVSRIDTEYDSLEWRSDPDGWAIRNCTTGRIKEMLVSMLLQYGEKDWQSEEWKEFEAAISDGGGTFLFVYPATMILARKK